MKTDHSYKIQHSLLTKEVFIMIVIDVLKLTNFSKKRLYQIIIIIIIIIHQQHLLVAISRVVPNPWLIISISILTPPE